MTVWSAEVDVFSELDSPMVRAGVAAWLSARAQWARSAQAVLLQRGPLATNANDVAQQVDTVLQNHRVFVSADDAPAPTVVILDALERHVVDELSLCLTLLRSRLATKLPTTKADVRALSTGDVVWVQCARLPAWPALVVGTHAQIRAASRTLPPGPAATCTDVTTKYLRLAVAMAKTGGRRAGSHFLVALGDFNALAQPVREHRRQNVGDILSRVIDICGLWVEESPNDFVHAVYTWSTNPLQLPLRASSPAASSTSFAGAKRKAALSDAAAAMARDGDAIACTTLSSAVSIGVAVQDYIKVSICCLTVVVPFVWNAGACANTFCPPKCLQHNMGRGRPETARMSATVKALDYLLTSAIAQVPTTEPMGIDERGTSNGIKTTPYAERVTRQLSKAQRQVSAVIRRPAAELARIIEATQKSTAATARFVAAAANEGHGRKHGGAASTVSSPFRRWLREMQVRRLWCC